MKTYFSLAKSKLKVNNENISIETVANYTKFTFYDSEKFKLAEGAKDFISEIYSFYTRNNLERHSKIRELSFNFGKFLSNDVLVYMNKIPHSEKKEIISGINNLSKKYTDIKLSNKFSQFTMAVKKLSKQYVAENQYSSIIPTMKSLYLNTLAREEYLYSPPRNQACRESYLGFIRAIRSNTLTTAKVIVNGEEKRFFFKSGAGVLENPFITKQDVMQLNKSARSLNVGYNPIAFDPETLSLYEVTTKGKKHYAKELKPSNNLLPKDKKAVQELLKKELRNHLDNIYAKKNVSGKVVVPGIKRMKNIKKRMSKPKPR